MSVLGCFIIFMLGTLTGMMLTALVSANRLEEDPLE